VAKLKTQLDILRSLKDAQIEGIFNGDIDPFNLPEDVYQAIANYLAGGIEKGIGFSADKVEFGTPDYDLINELRDNVYLFSAARTFQQTLEMSDALVGPDGEIVSLKDFKEAASEIFTRYNGADTDEEIKPGWIETEYNTTITQAENAKKWQDVEAKKELLPYLRRVAVGDDIVCDICGELNGITAPVDDPIWDEVAGAAHFNCRCIEEQLELEEGENNQWTDDEMQEAVDRSKMPDEFKYNPGKQKEIFSTEGKSQHPYFSVPKEYQAYAERNFDLPIPSSTSEQEAFNNFPRDHKLTGDDAAMQEASIKELIRNKDELVKSYLKDNGNVVNTDEARKQFIDLGYNGINAPAFHEASSALSKEALKELIENGTTNHIVYYAGGAGSGKSSAIEYLIPNVKASADAIIDGNLAKYESAIQRIDAFLSNGRSVEVNYVYRDPKEAWSGVIDRMMNNEKEMGRLVPLSTFLDNTTGSYNTIKTILSDTKLNSLENFRLQLIDNSLGKNKAAFMNTDKFFSIKYDKVQLKKEMKKYTKDVYESGKIFKSGKAMSREQYEALIK
jgi:SPP1 gp7 family putative phage head morphogenesis protein